MRKAWKFLFASLVLLSGVQGAAFACCCVDESLPVAEAAHDCCGDEAPKREAPEHCEDCSCDLLIPGQALFSVSFSFTEGASLFDFPQTKFKQETFLSYNQAKVPTPPPQLRLS